MLHNWKSWCRLCGKENGAEIDVFIKDENCYNIAEAIEKFLSITINITDEFPHQICSECRQLIINLLDFLEKSTKVQEMFMEIHWDNLIDLERLRTKYNLNHSNFVPQLILTEPKNENENRIIKKKLKKSRSQKRKTFGGDSNLENSNDSILMAILSDPTHIKQELTESDECSDATENDENSDEETVKKIIKKKSKKNLLKSEGSKRKYECEICNKCFNSQRGHSLHLKFKHSMENNTESYSCTICDKVFHKIQNLTTHKKMHLPPDERKWYPCPHCDKKFAAFWYVSVHIRTIHEKERSYICEECGKAFATSERLVAHKLVHTDAKPFQCPKCSKSFKCAPSLKHHVDSHEDTKYICSICGIQLNTKRILRRHMIVHSDKKKYKCNFCEKEFKRLDAFKHHLILHTGLKPYQCPFCEQTFANGSNCRKHQKHSHSKELALAEENGGISNVSRNIPSMKQLKAANDEAILDSINRTQI